MNKWQELGSAESILAPLRKASDDRAWMAVGNLVGVEGPTTSFMNTTLRGQLGVHRRFSFHGINILSFLPKMTVCLTFVDFCCSQSVIKTAIALLLQIRS